MDTEYPSYTSVFWESWYVLFLMSGCAGIAIIFACDAVTF